jgi:uncharacterized protein YjiS (DUF1127 family)
MFSTIFAPIYAADQGSALTRLAAMAVQWQARAAQRRALAELEDHLLQDIGVDRATATAEAAKPFWRN